MLDILKCDQLSCPLVSHRFVHRLCYFLLCLYLYPVFPHATYSSIMTVEAVNSSEMSKYFYQIRRRHNPDSVIFIDTISTILDLTYN